MSEADWDAGFVKCVGVRLAGDLIEDLDEDGNKIVGETVLTILNGHHEPVPFTLPVHQAERHWERLVDTADPLADCAFFAEKDLYDVQGRSVVLFRLRLATKRPAWPSPPSIREAPRPGDAEGSVSDGAEMKDLDARRL